MLCKRSGPLSVDRNIEVFNWLIPVGRDTTFICGLRSAGEIVSTYQTDSPRCYTVTGLTAPQVSPLWPGSRVRPEKLELIALDY